MRLENPLTLLVALIPLACGSTTDGSGGTSNPVGPGAAASATDSPPASTTTPQATGAQGMPTGNEPEQPILSPGVGGGASATASGANACATLEASTDFEPLYLAFAFDVSGSMGAGDYPWHDEQLKWEPVVAATRAFLEDPSAEGFNASLTAFPIDADEDERCDSDSYGEPDVPMTALPSDAFGTALTQIRREGWRSGTPTHAVVEGVLASIESYRTDHPGRYALVLVTDGYPQGCDDDSIESVAAVVSAAASDVPTYVIGVKNPPLTDDDGNMAPDTVSNLAAIAEAGGSKEAFIVDTGDPEGTVASFRTAIEAIRGSVLSCDLPIPAPPDGRNFENDHVQVSFEANGAQVTLAYNPDCSVDAATNTASGWHYDDVANPNRVVLCPTTCDTVQGTVAAKLQVGFTCAPVIQLLN